MALHKPSQATASGTALGVAAIGGVLVSLYFAGSAITATDGSSGRKAAISAAVLIGTIALVATVGESGVTAR